MIKLTVAVDKNNLIGKGNDLPWRIKEDLLHFKAITNNQWVLFGRKTFAGMKSNLPSRKIAIMTRGDYPGVDKVINSEEQLMEFLKQFRNSDTDIYICGGKSIYEKYFHLASQLIVSHVKGDYTGDCFLEWDLSGYDKKLMKEHEQFDVYVYTKKSDTNK